MKWVEMPTLKHRNTGFSLVEILVAVFVLAMLLVIVSQLVAHTSTLTRSGTKHYETENEARAVLGRMAADFSQMLRRTDVDYYLKSGNTRYPGHSAGHSKGG